MPEDHPPVHIAINVMRARLTVIGFNIAIVAFQIARLSSSTDGLTVPGVGHMVHVVADIELYLSLALSFFAMLALIMSSEFDREGICTHWPLMAGQLLMFLAIAHTASGFFAPLVTSIKLVASKFPGKVLEFGILRWGAVVAGGGAWFLATYVGPIVSLVRSPFQRRTNIALGVAYLLMLLLLALITAQTVRVESMVAREAPGLIYGVLRELVQPLRW